VYTFVYIYICPIGAAEESLFMDAAWTECELASGYIFFVLKFPVVCKE